MNVIQYNIVIPGMPKSKQAKSSKLYQKKVSDAAKEKIPYPLTAPRVHLSIHYFHSGRARADLDNITKVIQDGLEGVAYKDDNQVNHLEVKGYDITDDYWIKDVPGEWIVDQLQYNKPFVAIIVRDQ